MAIFGAKIRELVACDQQSIQFSFPKGNPSVDAVCLATGIEKDCWMKSYT
jgi:hypothetical protein